ncbi:hypothetical protein, partial [Streptomyces sp. NPDC048845]|uniref:hypothetical protein n=1 Tax=Streptomyces sp. NPDC048845 TaxID=3155390 RepID=UPI00341A99CB
MCAGDTGSATRPAATTAPGDPLYDTGSFTGTPFAGLVFTLARGEALFHEGDPGDRLYTAVATRTATGTVVTALVRT